MPRIHPGGQLPRAVRACYLLPCALFWAIASAFQAALCDKLQEKVQTTKASLELHRRLGVHAHADLLEAKLQTTIRRLAEEKRRLATCTRQETRFGNF